MTWVLERSETESARLELQNYARTCKECFIKRQNENMHLYTVYTCFVLLCPLRNIHMYVNGFDAPDNIYAVSHKHFIDFYFKSFIREKYMKRTSCYSLR